MLTRPGAASAEPPAARTAEITAEELRDLVRALSDDALEGRETGEPGCERAAEMVAAEFSRLGLRPAGALGSWFQPFTIPRGVRVLPTTSLSAKDAAGGEHGFALAKEFVPLDVSGAGDVEGDVAFVGYGIRAPDLRYDDFAGVDVRGKVVVVLRHAPAWQAKASPFADPKTMERYGSLSSKAEEAAKAGALALVVVNDPASSTTPEKDDLRPPGGGSTGRIPVVQLAWRAGPALERALGLSFATRQASLDASLTPASEALQGPRLRVHCDLEQLVRHARNVVALLPGDLLLAPTGSPRETLVLGAHYDHVGRGRFGSLAQADGAIHNGADDNASGTAALLEIAGRLVADRARLRRDVLFLAFSGEELGLFGSRHYVANPRVPLADTVAMLNLDMIGRLDDDRLYVGGSGTSLGWPPLLESKNDGPTPLRLRFMPGGRAPSDHESFYAKGIPVLFFFTGLHADYHRPSDDWDRINYPGEARVARLACAVAEDLLTRPDRPAFTKADDRGFDIAPTLGVTFEANGSLRIGALEEHGAGRLAGLEPKDVLVAWNGAPLKDAKDGEVRVKKAGFGESVELIVWHDGAVVPILLSVGST